MYDLTPMANGLLRKFSAASPGWFQTADGLALVRKAEALIKAHDGPDVARQFMDRLAVIQVSA